MISKVVMPLVMIGHEEAREVSKYDNDTKKKIKGTEVTKVRCLFVRTCTNSWDVMNDDGTYPHCHACVVDLVKSMFDRLKAGESYEFACDISEKDYKTSIVPKKVKIDGKIIDLLSEDVVSITDSDDDID